MALSELVDFSWSAWKGLLTALLCTGLACGGSEPSAEPPAPAMMRIHLVSTGATNGGGALHVLVRKTTAVDYPRQGYADIVATLSQPSDPSAVLWKVVLPDTSSEYQVPFPQGEALGVYFLFSRPGPNWSHLIGDAQAGPVTFRLGRDGILSVVAAAERAH